MTSTTKSRWMDKRTPETRGVEAILRKSGFERVDAYRYNSGSIRVRVIDPRFEGLSRERRDSMVETHLKKIPASTRADIVSLFTFAPSEIKQTPESFREFLLNAEFENPSPSML